ncbi:MAG TPA: FAD-dependent oxidoreductase, partial [Candidatus Saccharimonadales bacterium]|nr:FAD-dependent oxidoreductase [Candidatus Saccharimonadales bacterium]
MNQTDAFSALKEQFSGTIILPTDDEYDTARVTYAVIDAKPALIARAANQEDVAAAIHFATTHSLQLSIRSGKHSAAGFSTNTGGLVLDLSQLNSIEVLDEKAGLVRLGAGALWGDVANKLGEHSLAISSGDTKSVGVGGLTLGGGIGWMVRKYGYAIDSLVAAEVVLADGSVVHASEEEHSDLFWGLRGGGG